MGETADIEAELHRRLKGRVLLIGAGNTLRGDDGAGPELIALLEGKINADLLDVGEVPESYFSRILEARADTVVFIDAASFGGAPGDVAVFEAEDIAGCSLSTHQMPVDLFFRYIRQNGHAELFAIGIEPAQIGFGDPVSPKVEASVRALAELLQGILPPLSDGQGRSR
jgi:hydrogenase 3 maturation protease